MQRELCGGLVATASIPAVLRLADRNGFSLLPHVPLHHPPLPPKAHLASGVRCEVGGARREWGGVKGPSATGDDSEALGDAGHVVQHDAQEEEKHTGHEDHGAHPRPGGALPHRTTTPLYPSLGACPQRGRVLRDGHHSHALLLPAGEQAAAQIARQKCSLLGDGQWQHIATIARQTNENGRVLRGVWDGNDRHHVWVVWQLGDREACRQPGHAPAPGTADLLLTGPHLGQAHRAACVPAVQQFRPAPWAIVVEAYLTLQKGVLG